MEGSEESVTGRRPWELAPAEIRAIRDRIGDRDLIVSVSGGKDSTATALFIREVIGLPFQCVHQDTGWEWTGTDSYLRDELPGILGMPIKILTAPDPLKGKPDLIAEAERIEAIAGIDRPSMMIRFCINKAIFPNRAQRWCTNRLKVRPFELFIRDYDGAEPVNAVGVRAEESSKRAKLA